MSCGRVQFQQLFETDNTGENNSVADGLTVRLRVVTSVE
jgi:hypothetical protein